jgi:3-deoxy-D-manno-octulosonic-acid transferase
MHFIYSLTLFFSLFFYIPLYFFRLKILRGESLHLGERFGKHLQSEGYSEQSIWFHAVSVGEVLSLQNLIQELKKKHPEIRIYFSSLTNTGLQMAREKLVGVDRIFFIPMDFRTVARKFFQTLRPTLFVLAESEFWPNLLREAHEQTGKILLINGRISPRSFKKYYRYRFFFKRIMRNIDYFLVQTDRDRESLERIGIDVGRIEVAGNLKTEVLLPTFSEDEVIQFKNELNIPGSAKVVLAGSTRKGEEEKLIDAFAEAREQRDDIVFILAPRHPERAGEIEQLLVHYPFHVLRRSKLGLNQKWDVLILDSLGELSRLYALCDVAFIGGSLIPWGGQNLLEPASYGKPIFFGPHMDNFKHLADKFVKANAARIVTDRKDLIGMFLLEDELTLERMGKRAREILETFQGVTEKTLRIIETYLESS